MPRRHNQLFPRIADFQALHAAARRAIKGKRKKPGAASFFANLERELLALERQLRAGDYRPGRYARSRSTIQKSGSSRPRRSATVSCIMRSVRL